MKTPLPTIALGTLALLALVFPALGQDEPPPRTPWQKAEPTPGKAVRWIVEGCAAYPVTVDAEPGMPAPGTDSEAATGIVANVTDPAVPR